MKNQGKRFSWRARGRSFRYAFAGIGALLGEHNAWLHCAAAGCAIAASVWLHISAVEWCAVIICIGMVFAAEGINTAIEAVCDQVSGRYAPLIKRAKDVAAGAVLILAITSVAIGCIIFLPKLAQLL